jgi:hypothetical protein
MTGHLHAAHTARFALAAVLVLAACEPELATVFCTPGDEGCDIVGPPAFSFDMAADLVAALPAGTATVGATAVTVEASHLKALTAGQYQFWVLYRDDRNLDVTTAAYGSVVEFYLRVDIDPVTGDTIKDPLTGEPVLVTDSTIVSATRTNRYLGTDDPAVTSVRVIVDSTADGSVAAESHAVFLTVEGSTASTPGAARFLWRRIGVGGSGAMAFGTFGGSDVINVVSPNDYVYGVTGSGQGGIRGDEISVDLVELSRPPVGFFYRGFLVDADGEAVLVDTLHAAWSADTTVSRVSLFDADVNSLLPGVAGNDILLSNVRNCRQDSGVLRCSNTLDVPAESPFASFVTFRLYLEPKGGSATRSPTSTHAGELPDEVKP